MPINRRHFVLGAAALPVLGAMSNKSIADMNLGAGKLTTVSDGNLVLPADFMFEHMPKDDLSTILAEFNLGSKTLTPECNLALYQDGDRNILFDVGSGSDFMPSAGTVTQSLNALGLSPEEITHVVFTHAHPDHIWGLLDEFDDPLFSEASYFMGKAEWEYWWNPNTVNEIGDSRTIFAVGAKRRLEAIENAVVLFSDGDEILPGITAVSTPGHTPGHMSFEIKNNSTSAMILGDAIGNHHVAFRKPEWPSGSDQDAETAIKSRQMLFDRITAENMKIVGFHLPDGGIGRVEKQQNGFDFVQGDA